LLASRFHLDCFETGWVPGHMQVRRMPMFVRPKSNKI